MSRRRDDDLCCLLIVFALAAFVWVPTLGWGLPSRATDKALFGDRRPWTGAEIIALTAHNDDGAIGSGERPHPSPLPEGEGTAMRGADVDADPILDRSKPVVLNDTDAKRAEIVRRYRLMSGQPDEFIQFKALAEMSQRTGLARLDPRLYQYGGLWIYPVGALVRTAMAVGLIERPPGNVAAMAFYLDHPDAFGRFYAVARAYSAFWGFVALAAIYLLSKQATGRPWVAALAAIAFALLPVVRTATHEAKPHLAGAAICLWAVIAAGRFVEGGRRRWLIVAGALCGAATGMVMSMALSVVLLPAAWRMRQHATGNPLPGIRRRGQEFIVLIASLVVAAFVYVLTNPFVLYNAIANPSLLRSNLGNSTAMYGVGGVSNSIASALRISAEGAHEIGLVAAFAAAIVIVVRVRRLIPRVQLLVFVSATVALQFIILAAGKPAEYARFALVIYGAMCVTAAVSVAPTVCWLRRQIRPSLQIVACAIAVGLVLALFLVDIAPRRDAALGLRSLGERGISTPTIATPFEPAPWSFPPVDVFKARIVLVPRGTPYSDLYDALIYPTNLASQVGRPTWEERCDWRENHFAFEPRWDRKRSTTADTER